MLFVRFVLFCTDTVNEFLSRNCPHISGAIAFYALFSFFPLVLAVISVAGFLSGSEERQSRLAQDIAEVVPVSTKFVEETVQGVVSARAITGIVSILPLLWAASAAFGAVRKGINAAWGIKATRPFLRERMMDFTLVLGAGVLLMGALFITPIFTFLKEITDTVAPEADLATDAFWSLMAQLLTPVLSFLTFLLLYRFLPNTRVRLSDVWLGALLAAIAFEGAKWGFVWYVKTFPIYNAVYGTVGAIMALLTWVYVSAIILLFGALVTSRYASYPSRVRGEQGIKLLWTGLKRVRLRVVAIPELG
jgi:membrane protein